MNIHGLNEQPAGNQNGSVQHVANSNNDGRVEGDLTLRFSELNLRRRDTNWKTDWSLVGRGVFDPRWATWNELVNIVFCLPGITC